ncbi:hypothetical protein, partial [Ruegeria aquimaris]
MMPVDRKHLVKDPAGRFHVVQIVMRPGKITHHLENLATRGAGGLKGAFTDLDEPFGRFVVVDAHRGVGCLRIGDQRLRLWQTRQNGQQEQETGAKNLFAPWPFDARWRQTSGKPMGRKDATFPSEGNGKGRPFGAALFGFATELLPAGFPVENRLPQPVRIPVTRNST